MLDQLDILLSDTGAEGGGGGGGGRGGEGSLDLIRQDRLRRCIAYRSLYLFLSRARSPALMRIE